ncbi:TerC family protein [Tardiphaga sp. 1201_B9_N1_1]|jgi:YjbE family integral membrane protein|uniref:TerC family protein n=1 Tax=Tardiphaga robiniae TaxID=943830 RepID=A0A7G6U2G3_9BRAD|nr:MULTISPECIES: TerC family protein [Tardiphaga]QND73195.1 TerC family protein [Tardiphaga robiniae]SEH56097.1 integral membrane protein, YjbE family [Tardiphaga sp. OK245]
MTEFFTAEAMTALFQVVMIDLVLAGDNAIVIGLAAAGLPKEQRGKAILIGIIAATILRIGFASITVQLLQIIGLLLAGGILLLWVCWKMWRELRAGHEHDLNELENQLNADGTANGPRKTLGQAIWQITVADVSMSLDNVLAVAGAAREHPSILIFGLVLSIALMGLAASFIAKLLQKHRWIAYVGLAIILYVAGDMIYRGAREVWPYATAYLAPVL